MDAYVRQSFNLYFFHVIILKLLNKFTDLVNLEFHLSQEHLCTTMVWSVSLLKTSQELCHIQSQKKDQSQGKNIKKHRQRSNQN